MSESRTTLKTEENFNNEIGMPLTLLRLDKTHENAVIEMGMNARGEIERMSLAARPDAVMITNIGISHIGMLGSRDEILNAKIEITSGLKSGGKVIINGDDELLSSTDKLSGMNVMRYALETPADVKGEIIREGDGFSEVKVSYLSGEYKMLVPLSGRHNVYNALGAFSASVVSGVTPQAAIRGISKFKSGIMRQNIYERRGITIIEDCYNAAPDSMSAAFELLKTTATGRKIAVLSDMLELGEYSHEAHKKVGAAAAKTADECFVFGEFSESYREGYGDSIHIYPGKEELTNGLKDSIREGDTVLFKASRGLRLEEVIKAVFGE